MKGLGNLFDGAKKMIQNTLKDKNSKMIDPDKTNDLQNLKKYHSGNTTPLSKQALSN